MRTIFARGKENHAVPAMIRINLLPTRGNPRGATKAPHRDRRSRRALLRRRRPGRGQHLATAPAEYLGFGADRATANRGRTAARNQGRQGAGRASPAGQRQRNQAVEAWLQRPGAPLARPARPLDRGAGTLVADPLRRVRRTRRSWRAVPPTTTPLRGFSGSSFRPSRTRDSSRPAKPATTTAFGASSSTAGTEAPPGSHSTRRTGGTAKPMMWDYLDALLERPLLPATSVHRGGGPDAGGASTMRSCTATKPAASPASRRTSSSFALKRPGYARSSAACATS